MKELRARVGDHLVIVGHRVHRPVRGGEILEVVGEDGQPPYRVRWDGTNHETLIYPGPDARVERTVENTSPPDPEPPDPGPPERS